MRDSFNRYTKEITQADLERLFTRETPEAYHYFARDLDHGALAALPWYRRYPRFAKQFFMAFAMRLSPARRALYGVAVACVVFGAFELFDGAGRARALVGPFEDGGVDAVIRGHGADDPAALGRTLIAAVETYARDAKIGDDLTVLTLVRHADVR